VSPPAREVSSEMITGVNADEIAAKLADKLIAEGVL
jgi:hypothetical protein